MTMERLPNDMLETIGSRLNDGNLASLVGSSRSLKDALGPMADARDKAKVMGTMERMKQEAAKEPLSVVLQGKDYYYSFVVSLDQGSAFAKFRFGKNKRYDWMPRLETCMFRIDAKREPAMSMNEARRIAQEVVRNVLDGRSRVACKSLEAIRDDADRFFAIATIMTRAYELSVAAIGIP